MIEMARRYAIYSINQPLRKKIANLIDLTHDVPELYTNYPKNEHHWTTKYVWNVFLKRLFDDIYIPFNRNDFDYIHKMYDSFDLSYYLHKQNPSLHINNLTERITYDVNLSDTVFYKNFTSPYGADTGYHKLFLCSHRCAIITNQSATTPRNLIISTDSMSVPLMVYFIPYFSSILILDNRSGDSFRGYIQTFCSKPHITYIELFIADSWNFGKNILNFR